MRLFNRKVKRPVRAGRLAAGQDVDIAVNLVEQVCQRGLTDIIYGPNCVHVGLKETIDTKVLMSAVILKVHPARRYRSFRSNLLRT